MKDHIYTNLKQLEDESIHIIRQAASQAENLVMLYSMGKDSSVLLRLAEKAFYPAPLPFPLLHIDTNMKFQEMYDFRENQVKKLNINLIVYKSDSALKNKVNPHASGIQACCSLLKTKALIDALKKYDFDIAIGGARREEEKSRAKERIFSFRDKYGTWDPKNQRPEVWNLYNTRKKKGESIRVFPLSNWTEFDIWHYIYEEKIPVVPLYFAKKRKVFLKDGRLILAESNLESKEEIKEVMCRFRTLGCTPCTGAIKSEALSVKEIILETLDFKTSEREARLIDHDVEASMEIKKREGYF